MSVWSLKDGSLVRHTHALEVSCLSGQFFLYFSCRCLCAWMRFRSDVSADS